MRVAERKVVRCAIYTRKSTEEGLEQEFNSLDAQPEACAAYILSQRHEGWVQNADRYDDGGYSGGNMERTAADQAMNCSRAGGPSFASSIRKEVSKYRCVPLPAASCRMRSR